MQTLKPGAILERLYKKIKSEAEKSLIRELRIGLSYVAVNLDNGKTGLAAVLRNSTQKENVAIPDAVLYPGKYAMALLDYLTESETAPYRAFGLATANALIEPPCDCTEDREATTYFNLMPGEKVAMVGLFTPLVERIHATGAHLTIIEKNPARINLLSGEEKKQALKECDVAIITATTLLNNTLEETLTMLGRPRIVALMGPSTPLVPEIFSGTPINHLGGAIVTNHQHVLQVISEDGGTPALRPYLRFVNLKC